MSRDYTNAVDAEPYYGATHYHPGKGKTKQAITGLSTIPNAGIQAALNRTRDNLETLISSVNNLEEVLYPFLSPADVKERAAESMPSTSPVANSVREIDERIMDLISRIEDLRSRINL